MIFLYNFVFVNFENNFNNQSKSFLFKKYFLIDFNNFSNFFFCFFCDFIFFFKTIIVR